MLPKQLECAQLWPIATTESLQFGIRKSFNQTPTQDGQYLFCSRPTEYNCGQVYFIFGAGIEHVITSIPKEHDCYLCLSQQADILQCALTTGVLPLITSCNEGSLWQRRGWKVKANPSGTLIVSAEWKRRSVCVGGLYCVRSHYAGNDIKGKLEAIHSSPYSAYWEQIKISARVHLVPDGSLWHYLDWTHVCVCVCVFVSLYMSQSGDYICYWESVDTLSAVT